MLNQKLNNWYPYFLFYISSRPSLWLLSVNQVAYASFRVSVFYRLPCLSVSRQKTQGGRKVSTNRKCQKWRTQLNEKTLATEKRRTSKLPTALVTLVYAQRVWKYLAFRFRTHSTTVPTYHEVVTLSFFRFYRSLPSLFYFIFLYNDRAWELGSCLSSSCLSAFRSNKRKWRY